MNRSRRQSASVEETASDWVVRNSGPLSAAESAELKHWLAADPRHTEAFERLSRTWQVFDHAARSGVSGEIAVRVARRGRRRRRLRTQLAAVAVVLLLGVFVVSRPFGFRAAAPAAPSAVAETVRTLSDGTVVELKHDAAIEVRFSPAEREVALLRGEAHFSVASDPAHPFRVRAGAVQVVAVGTAFTVQLAPATVEVVVTEGRVAVGEDHAPAAAHDQPRPTVTFIEAGNRAVVAVRDHAVALPVVSRMSELEIERRLAWRAAVLEFEATELARAVALLNRANRVQISVADETIGRLHVSGSFRADNPDGFARMVEATFDLKADRPDENRIVLRRP